ncbi:MAG: N-acetyl-alpha-D-glucosaminyl L-malate synthase BshA [Candidatus Bathyarchaeota archaeon]|nr:N-acetyl-alpha-D-glucosaminyl L-malate synthase BshA [Candidatus Bathyarchaeota archaeon]
MKIGVTCYPTVGGSGILATRLGIEFARKGHETHFITYERPVAIQGVDEPNVYMHLVSVIEYPLFKYPPYTIALGSEMTRVTQKHDLDLLHVHYSIPHSTAAFLSKQQTGKPYVVTLHGSDVTILGSDPSYEPVNTFSVEAADAVTAVSKFMADEAKQNLGISHEIRVIPNFVDTEKFSPASCEVIDVKKDTNPEIVVTHVSNFRPVKRIQDLIYAMCIITKDLPNAKLILIGDGPDRHKVERLIDRMDLRKNISLTGYRSDVPELMRCADALVLCSETESAPLTILEAMSTGLPVVATKVGGVPEIVQDGKNGYLVPVKHPEEIAARLLDLASDRGKTAKMSENARKTVLEKYSTNKVVKQYMDVYNSITR